MVLAIKAGVEIVPVAISGTYEILPKGRLRLQPGNVLIRIGKPIPTGEYRTNQKHELALRLQKEVAGLLDRNVP
jgi:1-acyl-sn-glycerol-3-phosphate acyltransferase